MGTKLLILLFLLLLIVGIASAEENQRFITGSGPLEATRSQVCTFLVKGAHDKTEKPFSFDHITRFGKCECTVTSERRSCTLYYFWDDSQDMSDVPDPKYKD